MDEQLVNVNDILEALVNAMNLSDELSSSILSSGDVVKYMYNKKINHECRYRKMEKISRSNY